MKTRPILYRTKGPLLAAAVAALATLPTLTAVAEETPRSWKREADGNTVTATMTDYNEEEGVVTLKLENGTEAKIQSSVLSKPDQDYLAAHLEKLKAKEAELEELREAAKEARLESVNPEGGGGHMIHIYKPAGYFEADPDSKNRPVAFLYSAGGKSKDIIKRLQPAGDELGWLLVGIDAYRNTSSLEDLYDERLEATRSAFQWVSGNLSFDANKIVFGGMSGGGWWSFQSASELTQEAAGILSFGGWMGNMHDKRYSKDMAVAMINGDKDKNANHYEEIDGEFLKKRTSAEVKVFHFPGGHVLAPSDVALEAARWVHETKGF